MNRREMGDGSERGSNKSRLDSLAPTLEGCPGGGKSNDHLALIYSQQEEQLAAVVPFIREGLNQGERCLYVAADNTKQEVLSALRAGGVDVESARDAGALSIHSAEETYLSPAHFDRDAMIEFWQSSLEQAQDENDFEGLRAAAEMTWALDSGTNLDALVQYEGMLNDIYAGEDYAVLCQYNRNRFPEAVISDIIQRHPLLVRDGTVRQSPGYRDQELPIPSGDEPVVGQTERQGRGLGGEPSGDRSTIFDATTTQARVLYVDDDPDYVKTAAEYLECDDRIDTVVTETQPRAALNRIEEMAFDCIISDYEMPDFDGLELFEEVQRRRPDIPFILVTGRGDEGVASEAISAGVTDYLRKRQGTFSTLTNRVTNAVEQYRMSRTIRRTRRQYRRLIEESTDAIAVVNENGRIGYLSPASEERLGHPAGELLGEIWLEYVHPDDRDRIRQKFATLIDAPEERIASEFRFERPDGSWMWLEVRGRNLMNDPDIEGLVIYARDITDRKEREQALRESEQRFRSLFEKAFDAMVIADDDGTYVDANPAACDLFECSREELLGRSINDFAPDDYDFETAWKEFQNADFERDTFPLIGAEGTERTVEFAATPNIIPGQHLSILRDVTDRVEYEQTLTALHDAWHDLLDTESSLGIAKTIVNTAEEVLSMSAIAVYLFDSEQGLLTPAAVRGDGTDTESLDDIPLERDDPVGTTFLNKESNRIDSFSDPDAAPVSELGIRDGTLFPLGDHGVCIIGDTEAKMTCDDRELAEILITAAETALDRVAKESKLREQKTELHARNRKLQQVNQLNAVVREIDESLAEADTRTEIQRAVCEHLAGYDGIVAAWIGDYDATHQRLVPREWGGVRGCGKHIDDISLAINTDTSVPAPRAVMNNRPVHVENVADRIHHESWRETALSHGIRSVYSIPITYKDITYGAITVYGDAPGYFDEMSKATFRELSNKIATTINSVEHQNAVLAEKTTEVEIRLTDANLTLLDIARKADCSLSLETIAQQTDGTVLKRVSIDGAAPARVVEVAKEMTVISDASTVRDNGQEGLIELQVVGNPLLDYLADRGIRVPELTANSDAARLTFRAPTTIDVNWVCAELQKRYTDPEFIAKRERNRGDTVSKHQEGERYRSTLTTRQQEVLRTAYLNGFFESPRECTGEQLAEQLDIAPQTFYRHIRTAERKLFENVFSEQESSPRA